MIEPKEEYTEFPRYFLQIAYDGTNYHGWQRQPNDHSVQAEVEHALCKILRLESIVTIGCGRTDSGVHASDFYLHFVADFKDLKVEEVLFRLQKILPKDIAAYRLFQVSHRAHARFDATERAYEYRLIQRRDPFLRSHAYHYPYELDFNRMNEAAALLIGKHDFASFCKAGGNQGTTICDLRRAEWVNQNGVWVFHIVANRFLRNMVRAVVGTLLEVGRGKMDLVQFQEVIDLKKRSAAGDSVRPEGLFLTRVVYPPETFTI